MPRLSSGFHFFGFSNYIFYIASSAALSPTPSLENQVMYLCPPVKRWPSYSPGTGFPFRRHLRIAWPRWRYSNLPPHGINPQINRHCQLRYIANLKKTTNTIPKKDPIMLCRIIIILLLVYLCNCNWALARWQ
jgi:hypothetical protein